MDLDIYDEITPETALAVRKALTGAKPVALRINSPGGSVSDALAIYDALRNHKGTVTARVDGLAASAATLVMLAADEVVMAKHALLMVHDPWAMAVGNAGDMRKMGTALDKHRGEMVALYAERTGQSKAEVEDVMAAETWMNAEEAVEAGFAARVDDADARKPHLTAASLAYLRDITQRPEAKEARREAQVAALFDLFPNHPGISAMREDDTVMNQSVHQTRESIMAELGRDTTPTAHPRRDVGAFADNGNVVQDCMQDALQSRVGLAKLQEQQNPYKHHDLFDLARASLVDNGVGIASMGSKMQVVGAAFTNSTSDFGNLLQDTAEKSMLRGWDASGETFPQWTKKGSLGNFHTAQRVGMHGFPALPEVKEGAEYKHVTCSDRGAPIALATYGGIMNITRQAIINDDLSAFDAIPANLGRAASRTIGDLVYSVLTQNANMPDGKPLFHDDHGNIITTGAMEPSKLSEARHAMRMMRDSQGNVLNIEPAFVIVPAELEGTAMQVLRSTAVPGAETNSGIMNPANGLGDLVVEARLDADSTKDYYVMAAQGGDTIEVAYLDGVDQPYLEQQAGWTADGVSFKSRIDAGVAPLDYRGMIRCPGA